MNTCRIQLLGLLALAWMAGAATAATIQYAYDDAGRLTGADYGGGATIAYAYDANGNLLQRTTTEGGATTYTLIYRAGTGGAIVGVATQIVAEGQSGTVVTAVVENASAVFRGWSDGGAANPRTDAEVMADLTVIASFLSQGGADLDWYAARGIAPEPGEDWNDVDARIVAGKGTTLRHENVADTDPDNPADVFRVIGVDSGPPAVVQFQPGSTGRVYTFQFTEDLNPPQAWSNVPGVPPRPGAGGADQMQDAGGDPDRQIHYRIQVELP
jgi:YD repeat-containing protein